MTRPTDPPSTPESTTSVRRPFKVLTTTSANYEPIFSVFRESLAPCQDAELVVHALDLEDFGTFGFGEESWHAAIRGKVRFVAEYLARAATEGEHVVVCDADVQFLQPGRLGELVHTAAARELDFYGMREGGYEAYNGGFYIVRNGPAVRAMLGEVAQFMDQHRTPYADQEILNHLVTCDAYGLRHAKIPTEHCVWGDGWPTADAVFHHAVNTATAADKLHQMAMVRERWDRLMSAAGWPRTS